MSTFVLICVLFVLAVITALVVYSALAVAKTSEDIKSSLSEEEYTSIRLDLDPPARPEVRPCHGGTRRSRSVEWEKQNGLKDRN